MSPLTPNEDDGADEPVYIVLNVTLPDTDAILSSSLASPIFTVVPLNIVLADKPPTVTALMVCVPVR